jgi:hypothetical protein
VLKTDPIKFVRLSQVPHVETFGDTPRLLVLVVKHTVDLVQPHLDKPDFHNATRRFGRISMPPSLAAQVPPHFDFMDIGKDVRTVPKGPPLIQVFCPGKWLQENRSHEFAVSLSDQRT